MDDIRWDFVCRNKTEHVSTLLLGFGRSCRCERLLLLLVWVLFMRLRLFFCLGRILSCTVVADVACLGASLCVCVGVFVGFSLHF